MKKIFTLIAGALLATGAQAQGTWAVTDAIGSATNTVVYNSDKELSAPAIDAANSEGGLVITSVDGIKMTFPYSSALNNKWHVYDQSTDEGDATYRGLLTDASILGTTYVACGMENPKSSAGKNYSAGNKATLPAKGTYYLFETTADGTLEVAIKLNNGKSLYIADEDGTCYTGDAKLTDIAGSEVTLSSSYQTSAKTVGLVSFAVQKDHTYYVFCSGSKLGFFGFRFTKGEYVEDPGTPIEPVAWDFTKALGETDLANIAADDANWEKDKYEKQNKETEEWEFVCDIFQNVEKIQNAAVTANGAELEIVKGLKFNAGVNKFQIYNGVKLAHGGNGHGPIIPDCGKGDKVSIRYSVSAAERGFEVSNIDEEATEGELIASDKGTYEVTVTAKKKGDMIFSSVGGADILAISVNKELPEEIDTAVKTAKTATQQNGAAYNLAGQQVNDSFKGVVIQNGTKRVQK